MPTQSPFPPRGSPVPGVIPEPVRVVVDTGDSDPPAAPRRRHPVANLLARLLRAIRGDKSGPRGPRTGSQIKEG